MNPFIFSSACFPSLKEYSRNPVSIGGHCFNALILVSYSAINALLNLFSPSRANASSALKQRSAQWSTKALGLVASLFRFSCQYAFAFSGSVYPLSSKNPGFRITL